MEQSNFPFEQNPESSIFTSLLTEIFFRSTSDKLTKVIKTTDSISDLLEFLYSKYQCLEKIQLINYLTFNFRQLAHNVDIFSRHSTNVNGMKYSLLHVLIDLFLRESHSESDDTPEDIQLLETTIKECLEVCINHIDCKKDIFEFVYLKLSQYYRDEGTIPLTKRLFMKYLSVLRIIYGGNISSQKPESYFYFSGGGGIIVDEGMLKENKIKMTSGCVVAIWFKIEIEPEELEEMSPNHVAELIRIECGYVKQTIRVYLRDAVKLFISNYSEKEYVQILPAREWIQLSLLIKPKSFMRSPEFTLCVNNTQSKYLITNFNCDTEITDMAFFNNFIGQSTTIMYMNKSLSEDYLNILTSYPLGIFKHSQMYHFLKSGNERHMQHSNHPHFNKFITLKNIEAYSAIVDSMKIFYTPIQCSNNDIHIEDSCENYFAYFDLLNGLNGVHFYHCYMKNIYLLGGINNLLPIAELMHMSVHSSPSYKLLTPILDDETFFAFLEVINIILSYRKKNMKDAVHRNFFQLLSLFIEKFPKGIFTEKILEAFICIAKSLFTLVDQCKLSCLFFDNILLNEKVFSKFPINVQANLWNSLYQFYVSDVSQVKSFMNMSKICLLLRYYDENRYVEYCCSYHANIFKHDAPEKSFKAMNPEMKARIENLIQIIQFIVDNSDAEKSDDAVTLCRLLSLDLSPCLQKFILTIFYNYFSNNKIPTDKKSITLSKLLSHNCIDAVFYIMSISLLDIRYEIIKVFSVISMLESAKNLKSYTEKIFPYVQEFVLPLNLRIEKKRVNEVIQENSTIGGDTINDTVKSNQQVIKCPLTRSETVVIKQHTSKKNVIPPISLNGKTSERQGREILSSRSENKMQERVNDINAISPLKRAQSKPYRQVNYNSSQGLLSSKCQKSTTRNRSSAFSERGRQSLQPERTINIDKKLKKYESEKDKLKQQTTPEHKKYQEPETFKTEEITTKVNPILKTLTKGFSITTETESESVSEDLNINEKKMKIPKTEKASKTNVLVCSNYSIKEVIEEESCEGASPKKKDLQQGKSQLDKVKFKLTFNDSNESPRKRGLFISTHTSKFHLDDKCTLPKPRPKKKSNTSKALIEDILKASDELASNLLLNSESLCPYFNEDNYNEQLDQMYNRLITWMLKKSEPTIDSIISFDEKDFIFNPPVIEIIISFIQNSDMIYIHKFMRDLNCLVLLNKDNCVVLSQCQIFYTWLIETLFKCFQMKSDDYVCKISTKRITDKKAVTTEVFELGKIIHKELIVNSISRDDKQRSSGPMNNLHFLLTWGLYYKCIYDHNRKITYDVNDFLRLLFQELLLYFEYNSTSVQPNMSSYLWENYMAFASLCYEFMTFYNLDKTIKQNSINFLEAQCDAIIIPTCLFSGLSLDPYSPVSEKIASVRTLWTDYSIFEKIYKSFKHIWSFQCIGRLAQLEVCDDFNMSSLSFPQFDTIMEELIFNKSKKDSFIEELIMLTHIYTPDGFCIVYDLPLMKVMSNLLTITITLIQEESEAKFWINEYQQFLLYVIIASTNMTTLSNDFFTRVQEMSIDVISFGLCFIIDQYLNSRKSSYITRHYFTCIRNIFILVTLILDYSHKQIEKRKKKLGILSSLLKKTKVHDLSKCAVYRIFNEFVYDSSGNILLNPRTINEMKMNNFSDIPLLFKKEVWKQGLTENPSLKKKLKSIFDFSVYESICTERYNQISQFTPIYENIVNGKETMENLELKLKPIFKDENSMLKKSVHKSIEILIPFYEREIKKYSNRSFLGQKTKRNTYKMVKKKLFSWRGMWSDRDLFFNHPEKLKLKMLNHYTSQLARPLLIPILDVNYYIPEFTHFKVKNLFRTNDASVSYKINLDIDDILKSNVAISAQNQNSSCSVVAQVNYSNTNYIKDIYQYTNPTIWRSYLKISDKINFSKEAEYIDLLNKFRTTSTDPNLKKMENYYECCFVKPSHHIKGIFYINKHGITFRVFLNQINGNNFVESQLVKDEDKMISALDLSVPMVLKRKQSAKLIENKNEDDFDYDRNTCFGSYFVSHRKDKDTFTFDFAYNEIKYIFKRRYYYKKSAIEMFSMNKKSYYFNFKNPQDRDRVINEILAHLEYKREIRIDTKDKEENMIAGYENLSSDGQSNASWKPVKCDSLSAKIEAWAKWRISNFELLMWLNIFANRSYSDISQYPVFPWILSNYTTMKIDIDKDLRRFSLPMGMMDLDDRGAERKHIYLETYDTLKSEQDETSSAPYCYGSHYSNPMYVSHYLLRMFPFSHIQIELQGNKFDDPNRLFISIANSFDCATTQKGDVRELIPEFFFLPEMFLNLNNLNLGIKSDLSLGMSSVTHVQIPDWANNDAFEFVLKMREILESEEVSKGIGKWIDLVFGYKQRGKEAENAYNVFIPTSYEDAIGIETLESVERAYYLRLVEFGMTPHNLFSREFRARYSKSHIKRGRQINECKELRYFLNLNNKQKPQPKERPMILKIKVLDNDKVMCVFNNYTYQVYKTNSNSSDTKLNMNSHLRIYITQENMSKIGGRMKYLDKNYLSTPPIVIYNNGKIIAQGGYWDGRITICYQDGTNTKMYNLYTEMDSNPVVVLTMDKDERYAFSGTTIGTVNIYQVNEYKWETPSRIYHHTDEITSFGISNTLNMWASSGADGYVHLYTSPMNRMTRCIKMPYNSSADNVFLSSCPLPAFVIYSKSANLFYSYSINGCLLCEQSEESGYIISPVLFTDITFCDFLIYGTSHGMCKIRKLPTMSLISEVSIAEHKKIKCIDITEDKTMCYLWTVDGHDIILIKDPSFTSEAATMNLIQMGFASY